MNTTEKETFEGIRVLNAAKDRNIQWMGLLTMQGDKTKYIKANKSYDKVILICDGHDELVKRNKELLEALEGLLLASKGIDKYEYEVRIQQEVFDNAITAINNAKS